MHRTDLQYLDDIIDAIHNIKEDTEGLSFQEFDADRRRKDAVIRNLEIMGEATKKISDTVKSRFPEVPWRRISGLRDVVAHGYFTIDYEIIWGIITNTLPDFKDSVNQIRDFQSMQEGKPETLQDE